jgi:hypothetical protein
MSESVMETDEFGNKFWKNSEGQIHRTDGPAVEFKNGHTEWYVNGERHRLNGPAIVWPDGDTSWYVNGECLGRNDKGFWNLWDTLAPEQKQDPTLLSYLPTAFSL